MSPIERLTGASDVAGLGGKAGYLGWLIAQGETVPPTWVIRPSVDRGAIEAALQSRLDGGARYAVRSSANVEDGAVSSYAGQFATELDVGRDEVAAAVERVRASAQADRVTAYRDRRGEGTAVAMNVVVQPMVTARAAGVAFSRNPITGLNEVVVEAVAGRGDRLVDAGVTPDRWIRRWGTWSQQPAAGAVPDHVALAIASATGRIDRAFGAPVDLEWVWDGERVWWVQLRPITGLDSVSIYSNRISREVMPGIIKPLVWSVNVPMVNQAWVDLFSEAIGPNEIEPESLAKAFAYRSYFNMGAIGDIFELLGMPRDSLELLLGLPGGAEQPSFKPSLTTMKLMPRMLAMAARKARYGRRVVGEVEALMAVYRGYDRRELGALSDGVLLDEVRALSTIGVRAAYTNVVTPLLANLFNSMLRQRLANAGLDPESVDLGGTADLADVNPNVHLDVLRSTFDGLDEGTVASIRTGGYGALPPELRAEVDAFLHRFGHLSASGNDFSVAPWREMPDAVVAMMLDHAAVRGGSASVAWAEAERAFNPIARPVMRALRDRTGAFIAHRESVSFMYTYGYGLFRRYFLEIGRRLVDRGVLERAGDVMYLYLDEVRASLIGPLPDPSPAQLVAERRDEIDALRDVEMPEVIYGDDFVPVPPSAASGSLRGIPTSRGHHRGIVRVVRDVEGFGTVEPGDVIAIPYSDVGWTPLFARAGAVVAEAGGMLSHSSIVAREYGIPCVVLVEGATRLPDGATVIVDGYAGTVIVEEIGSTEGGGAVARGPARP